MSSKNCQPFFYIIRHKLSGKLYAGSKYGKDSNPNTFLTQNGYTTSSEEINKIISEEGLSSFEILRIDTFCDNLHPYDYETLFLKSNKCANSKNWFNKHNNTRTSFESTEFKNFMIDKYGVEHCMFLEQTKEKIKKTSLQKYGVEHYNKTEESKNNLRTLATKIVECPHCNKTGASLIMSRHHFNHCKYKLVE